MSMSVRKLVVAGLATLCVAMLGAGSAQAQVGSGLLLASASQGGLRDPAILVLPQAGGGQTTPAANLLTSGDVMTEPASEITSSGAKLNGTVLLAGGGTVHYYFEYGTSTGYGTSTAEAEVGVPAGSGEASVAAKISGLQPGQIYHYRLVAESTDGNDQEFDTGVVPPSEPLTEPATVVSATNAQLNGKVDPGGRSSYYFEYGTSPCEVSAHTCGSKTREETIEGSTQRPVPAVSVAPLIAGTTYYYWLVASNSAGAPVYGQQQTFTTPAAPPLITAESVTEVGPHGATLSAQVTTQGLPLTYYFEYGATSAYGSRTPAASSGSNGETVTATLTGLVSTTLYHFRVVVVNEDGAADGGDLSFTTFAPVFNGLPDGRVYELVSRAENQERDMYAPKVSSRYNGVGFDGYSAKAIFEAAKDGDADAYIGEPSSPGGTGTGGLGAGNQYLSTRGPNGGWSQINLQPPGYLASTYQAFLGELSTGILTAASSSSGATPGGKAHLPPLAPGAPAGVDVLYARTPTSEETYSPLFTVTPPNRASDFYAAGVPTTTFSGEEPAYAGGSTDGSRLFFEGNDALVPPAELGSGNVNNLYESADGQLSVVNVLPDGTSKANATFGGPALREERIPDFSHAISEDGTRVYWTELNTRDIYVRENGTTTVPVSAGSAQYWTATPDGRYAYYTEGGALWRFDIEGETRTALAGSSAGVQGVIGVSNDGQYVYFVAGGVLAAGATSGAPNIYLLHGGVTTFIATISEQDESDIEPYDRSGTGDVVPGLGERTSEVTPNGQTLAFMSNLALTGYDNDATLANTALMAVEEAYVYQANENRLICISCSRTGLPPRTNEMMERGEVGGFFPVSWENTNTQQWISEDGRRVFFDSPEALVPQDTNETQDVYEWERNGTGSCEEDRGCIYLLTGGTDASASWLVGASANGNDVFVSSRAKFAREDGTEDYVIYDARVGGVQPVTPPMCSGTGCQGIPSAPPVFATPSSVTFNGVGNFPPPAGAVAPSTKKPTAPQTKGRKLAKALEACRRKRSKRKRDSCKVQAKRRSAKKSDTGKAPKGRK
jgi:hypothetical protein